MLYGYTNIAWTIAENEGLTVSRTFGKETPAFIDHCTRGVKNKLHMRTGEQVGYDGERYTANEIAKCIDVQNMCVDMRALPLRRSNIYAL